MTAVEPRIVAALGPTNTGKTHRAVERMLDHPTGMLGLPLRLLAREVYDRVSQRLGEAQVALVTGEEKRIPPDPRYWICTVEAMPIERAVDFLGIDEIQLAAHQERGHVFTDRLLHARGRQETWFMGADTMRPLLKQLVPEAKLQRFPRLSRLSASGSFSLGGLPPRSAVVAFSAHSLYQLAERLRHRRGGAAVVMGALSPRARNAQVAMYQAGEVDYLVATDAIGMGLNLDVERVAFAERRKFDGRETRGLDIAELSQIAGRAGRFQTDGAFGTLAPEPRLPAAVERRIESHRLPEQKTLVWRNHQLCFESIPELIDSLKQRPAPGPLRALGRAADFRALTTLAKRADISERAQRASDVELLWQICQVPDYPQLAMDHHENLLGEIFLELTDRARLCDAFLETRVRRLDRVDGDIETLMRRMANVRTWTYVTNHDRWLERPLGWQERTREIEDHLSDALHEALVTRFIDRGRSGGSERARATTTDPEHPFSALAALKQRLDPGSAPTPPAARFSHELAEAPHGAFSVSERGGIVFGRVEVARFTRGRVLTEPEVALGDLELAPGATGQVRRRLLAFAKDFVMETLGELCRLPANASGALRGVLYQLQQTLGTLPRPDAESLLVALGDDDRRELGALGISIGRRSIIAPALFDARALGRRRVLARAFYGDRTPALRPGALCAPAEPRVPHECYLALGYLVVGGQALRADVLEDLLASSPPRGPSAQAIGRRCQLGPEAARKLGRVLGQHPRRRRRRRRPAAE